MEVEIDNIRRTLNKYEILDNMDHGAKTTREILNPGEIVDRFVNELFEHDAATQDAVLNEVRGALISDYIHKKEDHIKEAAELDHSANILKGNIPKSSPVDSGIRDNDTFVEHKNYRTNGI